MLLIFLFFCISFFFIYLSKFLFSNFHSSSVFIFSICLYLLLYLSHLLFSLSVSTFFFICLYLLFYLSLPSFLSISTFYYICPYTTLFRSSGYCVAFSILVSSVQPNTVSVRVFCGPTMCRARGNEVSAMNILTRKSGSE